VVSLFGIWLGLGCLGGSVAPTIQPTSAWPAGVPDWYTPAFVGEIASSAQRMCPRLRPTHVDCGEYPCTIEYRRSWWTPDPAGVLEECFSQDPRVSLALRFSYGIRGGIPTKSADWAVIVQPPA